MKNTLILRFRDLITEDDGTIDDHLNLISNFGEVWWGWWMKQTETSPRDLFGDLISKIGIEGYIKVYLFNTGLDKIYEARVIKILVAPLNNRISTPDPERSPNYYHRGSYPAWFLINEIVEVDFNKLNLELVELPTRNNGQLSEYNNAIGKKITTLTDLQKMNVTLWSIKTKENVSSNSN